MASEEFGGLTSTSTAPPSSFSTRRFARLELSGGASIWF
jgi:hypothetical protein